jgi:hypothetical protein
LFNGLLLINKANESKQVMQGQKVLSTQVAVNDGIQVIAKRPYIRRGEIGVLALRCTPNNNCKIVCSYKIRGKDFTTTRNIVAGKDGNVLCTWKVDRNTDTGTYDIEIVCGGNRLVTNYVVQ